MAWSAVYPTNAVSFQDKTDHVDPVVAGDINAVQSEISSTQTFVGIIGELPPSGDGSSGTVGSNPTGVAVVQRVIPHVYMLNEWVAKLKDDTEGLVGSITTNTSNITSMYNTMVSMGTRLNEVERSSKVHRMTLPVPFTVPRDLSLTLEHIPLHGDYRSGDVFKGVFIKYITGGAVLLGEATIVGGEGRVVLHNTNENKDVTINVCTLGYQLGKEYI